MIPSVRTARFMRAYLRGGAGGVRHEEIRLPVSGEEREATLFLPERRAPAPGWVVLHGMTVPGRQHLAMGRFVRSLAASGAAVVVPDVPAWRTLRADPRAAHDTLLAGARYLEGRPEVREGPVGAIGFSFGATQALIAASDPELAPRLGALVGFGGYCDMGRVVRFLFTGEHDWQGVVHRTDPDPYGRWILAGNYLTRVPGLEGMTAVQDAALELALESGRRGTWAWEEEYDPLKEAVRARLAPAEREVWDVVAPPTNQLPSAAGPARELAERFAAVMAADKHLDPLPHLDSVDARLVLSHGRADRLIPYTEALRLQSLLPARLEASTIVTGLFAHSAHAGWMNPVDRAREAGLFIRLLNRALAAV